MKSVTRVQSRSFDHPGSPQPSNSHHRCPRPRPLLPSLPPLSLSFPLSDSPSTPLSLLCQFGPDRERHRGVPNHAADQPSDTKWGGMKAGQIMADPKPVFARIENRKEGEDEVVHKVVNDKKKTSRSQALVQARQQYLALSTIAGRLLVDAEKAHD